MEARQFRVLEREQLGQEELEAIEIAFSIADEASIKRKSTLEGDRDRSKTRRLPSWGANSSTNQALTAESCAGSQKSLEFDNKRWNGEFSPGNGVDSSKNGEFSPGNGFWNLVPSTCQVNPKVKYPAMNFGGRIIYGRTFLEVERATMELLEIIKAMQLKTDQISLGFDIEWRPTFRRVGTAIEGLSNGSIEGNLKSAGELPRNAAVMQICVDNSHCYVMHIIHSGIPPVLQSLLEDSTSVKVGVGIANDAVKVLKDYNVHIRALEDLSGLANLKLGGIPRKWSLSALTEMLISKQLAKPNKIRMGDWEVNVLSKEQLRYAATDAFASWYLYQVLNSLPDASENLKVEEKVSDVIA